MDYDIQNGEPDILDDGLSWIIKVRNSWRFKTSW